MGLFLPKGREAVATIHGVLRSGAAYVPVDPGSPPIRGAGILADAGVKAVVVSAEHAESLRDAWPEAGPLPRFVVVGEGKGRTCPTDASWDRVMADDAPSPLPPAFDEDDLAYILYTSGSTGTPKGVMLSHANAFAFLDWCDHSFDLEASDRFASHAPFHFDLSIFDLYASCRVGATLVLIGESTGKDPARLGAFLAERAISVWYSAPSILALLADHGGVDRLGHFAPRIVLFAGEVFPVGPLRKLRRAWPDARLWNLYGPTETNVCTAFAIPRTIDDRRETPFPIGPACPPSLVRVVDEHGRDAPARDGRRAGHCRPRGDARLLRPPHPDPREPLFLDDEHAWYRIWRPSSPTRGTAASASTVVATGWSRSEATGSSWARFESALYKHEAVARDRSRRDLLGATEDGESRLVAFVAMKPGLKGSIIALRRHSHPLPPALHGPRRGPGSSPSFARTTLRPTRSITRASSRWPTMAARLRIGK